MNRASDRRPAAPAISRPDSDVVLRAVAIASVVWNHANPQIAEGELGGGMTFLMLLSGYSFARFSIRNSTPGEMRRALGQLSLRIGLPSLLLVLFFFAILGRFDIRELLFISNWWTLGRISIFPTWYPQVMLQMFAGLFLLFATPAGALAVRYPLQLSATLFLTGIALRMALPAYVWDTAYLHHNLPHLFLWNFTLGWVVYFLVGEGERQWPRMLAALAAIALGAYAGWGLERNDFWWLLLAGAVFVPFRKLPMPRQLAAVLGLVSQAAFVIFLLHRFTFVALAKVVPAIEQYPPLLWLSGIVLPVAFWVALTAGGRAYRVITIGAGGGR